MSTLAIRLETSHQTDEAVDVPLASESDLIACDEELRWLNAAFGTAQRGGGILVAVEGAAGTGRSRFLHEARIRARRLDAFVLSIRTLAAEQRAPYSAFGRLCATTLRRLQDAAASPEDAGREEAAQNLARAIADADRDAAGCGRALVGAFGRALATLAAERLVLVAVDDVDRCDRASLHALATLALALDDLGGIVLVLTRQHHAVDCADVACLDALFADPGAVRIRLRPLDAAGIAAVLAATNGAPAPELVDAVEQLTRGNPYLVREVALAIGESGLAPTGGSADLVREVGIASVAHTVVARTATLGTRVELLLAVLAVLGEDASLPVAAELAGLSAIDAADLCGALTACGVLATHQPPTFAQPLLRPSLLATISPGERLRLHGRAARSLAAAGSATAVVARHLLLAEARGDSWAADRLRDAADGACDDGRLHDAMAYLRRALAEGVPEIEARLSRQIGVTAAALGDETGLTHLERALELTTARAERAEIGLALVRLLAALGLDEAARWAGRNAMRELDDTDEELRTRLEAELAALARASTLTRATDSPGIEDAAVPHTPAGRFAFAQRAELAAWRGDARDEVVDNARRALGDGGLFEEDASLVWHSAVNALVAADELEEAAAIYDFAAGRADVRGRKWTALGIRAHRARIRLRSGDVAGAVSDARAAHDDDTVAGSLRAVATVNLAEALLEAGDVAAAATILEQARQRRRTQGGIDEARLACARALVFLAQGRHADALRETDSASALFAAIEARNPAVAPWRTIAALGHLGLDDRARARALALEELSLARAFEGPTAIARALRILARVSDGHDAVQHCREAVEGTDGSPAQLEHAHALVDLGGALCRAGCEREARDVLRRGMEVAHRCGAAALASRARDALVAAGGRPRRPVHHGLDGLTRSERRVAELAAGGQTNREIGEALYVTINTVSAHLGSVYRKLGINSRAQLPVALASAAA